MTRAEILAANPLGTYLESRGIVLRGSRGSERSTSRCPLTEHAPNHYCVSVNLATGLWFCNDCGCGGSRIDWEAIETGRPAGEVYKALGGNGEHPAPPKRGSNPDSEAGKSPKMVKTYNYTDEAGTLLYQCCRYEPKTFRQRAPTGHDGWTWSLEGVRRVLYNLPAVLAAETVWLCEGEKDADNLIALGLVATTNAMGAGKWCADYTAQLSGKHVVLCPDNDEAGHKHRDRLSADLAPAVRSLRIVQMPDGIKDVSDLIASEPEEDHWPARLEAMAEFPGSKLKFVDLGELVRRGLPREMPTVAEYLPGKFLLYAGRLNEIHGEPSVGKTNVACVLACAVLSSGGHVLYLDPEDTPQGIAARLSSFGASDTVLSAQLHYLHNPDPDDYLAAHRWITLNPCALVICDGLAEALAAEGLSEDKPLDVLPFFRARLRPFAESGAAVLISDHVTKGKEDRGRWARGSGAKLGRYDGACFSLDLGEPYTPDKPGFVRILIAKDRVGSIGAAGVGVAELHFLQGAVEWRESTSEEDFRPTVIMERILEHLAVFPDASKRDLRSLGKAQYVDKAIVFLVNDGLLRCESKGTGSKTKFVIPE